jgi:DNA-binding SARP family transcriptional activator
MVVRTEVDGGVTSMDTGDTTRSSAAMQFRLLGPLEVVANDRLLDLGGTKQRSLLAILLLNANQFVSTDRLIDELWGSAPPATASKSVQVMVSKLRKKLGPDRLASHALGYALRVDAPELDLARFERLIGEARGVAPETAARKLREALALWRGAALADLGYEPFAQADVARLEELRLVALDQRIDADLAAGRHAELVGELEAVVIQHPLRERLRYQLILALYRSARQPDALAAYRAARRDLSVELGLEPSEALKKLEQAILRQDPALDLPAYAHSRGVATTPSTPSRALLVVPRAFDDPDALLTLARPLAASQPPRELIVALVVRPTQLQAATAALAARRDELVRDGLTARTAAFSSPKPGEDVVRLTSQESVDLLLVYAGRSPLDGESRVVVERAPCDVALLLETGGAVRSGPIVVPFGPAGHDWAALELGAWVAHATGASLRLIDAASERSEDGRDASRLLADASLIVQRTAGIVAEPLLASPGRRGILALAEGAGLLVVGLSDRRREEGLGRVRCELAEAPPAPTAFVRSGPRPGGLAPAETWTRFSWSLTGGGR